MKTILKIVVNMIWKHNEHDMMMLWKLIWTTCWKEFENIFEIVNQFLKMIKSLSTCCWNYSELLLKLQWIVVEITVNCCWNYSKLLLKLQWIVVEITVNCCWNYNELLLKLQLTWYKNIVNTTCNYSKIVMKMNLKTR